MSTTEDECPAWVPAPAELADLELLLDGAFPPLTGFLGVRDVRSVRERGCLTDGVRWPVPITVSASPEIAACDRVELRDCQDVPVAVLDNVAPWSEGGTHYLAGPVRSVECAGQARFPVSGHSQNVDTHQNLDTHEHLGTYHHSARAQPRSGDRRGGGSRKGATLSHLRPPAAEVRQAFPEGPVVAAVVDQPLHRGRLAGIRHAAEQVRGDVLLLPRLLGPRPEALVEAMLAARAELPDGTTVVPVPLPRRHRALDGHVAAAYGATHLMSPESTDEAVGDEGPIPVVPAPEVVRDSQGRWLPADQVPQDERHADLTERELARLLDTGHQLPEWFTTPAIANQQVKLRPPLHRRGITVLFTGLSGAGKSTIAHRLREELAQHDDRAVTLLDGDVVRRHLCAGLGFSPEDRSRNVRRIGWVAAEVTRHGGAALCAPIAPYASDRAEVRRMVEEVGEFLLVSVATSLDECERRDRKGLYSKARAGVLPEFTGVSAPYETPEDADLVLDTATLSPREAVAAVIAELRARGWVRAWTST